MACLDIAGRPVIGVVTRLRAEKGVSVLLRALKNAVPSLFEGFGLSAAEAMAAGRAVVGTGVDGLVEVIENGITGYLVPPGDSRALADVLIRTLRDPRLAAEMGTRGRVCVSEHFSPGKFSETILVAYRHYAAL